MGAWLFLEKGKLMKKHEYPKSIKRTIYKNNMIITIGLVLFFEIIINIFINNYYIGGVEYEVQNKAEASMKYYNTYLGNKSLNEKIKFIIENDSRDKNFYTQIFDSRKRLIIDSSGNSMQKNSIKLENEIEFFGKRQIVTGKDLVSGENIMSISLPLYYYKDIVGFVRYVVSIDTMYDALFKIRILTIAIGSIAILISVILSKILVNRMIKPIEKLTQTARKMASGDFSTEAPKIQEDEIGRLSDTLNYMAQEIKKSEQLKNEFISSVSHELRTPLTAIRGWTEILLDNPEMSFEGLKIIDSETKRLSKLVEDLLDFSKLKSGKIILEFSNVDMNKLIEVTLNQFRIRFNKKNINLKRAVKINNLIVTADQNRLKQVMINIIDNAIKFTKDEIFVSSFIENNYLFFVVEDNGIGVSKEDIKRIKEKFYKGKSKNSGSGLGLAICEEIIHLHKGDLKIESEEGKGTRVSFYFPLNLEE